MDGTMTREELIVAIERIEARLEKLHNWALSNQIVRMRTLQARLLELEAWAAEPNLIDNYTGL